MCHCRPLVDTILKTKELIYFSTRSDMRDKRALITDSLKLKSFGMAHDLALVPPYWDDPNCVGGVHFNTFALTDCAQQSPKIVFVGAGVSEEPNSSVQSVSLRASGVSSNNELMRFITAAYTGRIAVARRSARTR